MGESKQSASITRREFPADLSDRFADSLPVMNQQAIRNEFEDTCRSYFGGRITTTPAMSNLTSTFN